VLAAKTDFCNAETGDGKSNLSVTIKKHFVNCQSAIIKKFIQKGFSMCLQIFSVFLECDATLMT